MSFYILYNWLARIQTEQLINRLLKKTEKTCHHCHYSQPSHRINNRFAFRWYSYLTACTKTCGKGTQHKKIECRRLATDHYRVVSDSECTETRPTVGGPDLTYCSEIACPPIYKLGPWSKVSKMYLSSFNNYTCISVSILSSSCTMCLYSEY